MSTRATVSDNARFKAGRTILLVTAALMTLNHAVIIFILDEPVRYMSYAAFTLYALVVLAIPFRRHEKWAWYASWILPTGLAAVAALSADPNIMPFYYGAAALCVLGLLLTVRDFFAAPGKVAPGMS